MAVFAYSKVEFFVDDVTYKMQGIDDKSHLSHFMVGKTSECDNESVISNFPSKKINNTKGFHKRTDCGITERRLLISKQNGFPKMISGIRFLTVFNTQKSRLNKTAL